MALSQRPPPIYLYDATGNPRRVAGHPLNLADYSAEPAVLARRRLNGGPSMRVVVLTGPESTGKSWLANDLHSHFGGMLVSEYVRQFIDDEKRDTCFADIPIIARRQLMQEDAARQRQPELLILDTNLLSNMLWSRTLFNDCPEWLEAELLSRRYDQYLLLSPEGAPWIADGQRCQPDPAQRNAFYQACESWLNDHQQPMAVISGSWSHRQAYTRYLVEQLLTR